LLDGAEVGAGKKARGRKKDIDSGKELGYIAKSVAESGLVFEN
jgi:hypothetical protein